MPTPTYTALATVTLGSSAASVTFSSIPATYRDLILVIVGTASGDNNPRLRLNGDTGNASWVGVWGNGSSATTASNTDALLFGALSTGQSNTILQIMDYSATDKHKTILSRANQPAGSVWAFAGRWASTSAVTSAEAMAQSGFTYGAGTTFSLYGVIA
jgi:hypothetical protein